MTRLTGKRAFVTAAGQGIGRAVALAFAREGARVQASDIDGNKLAGLEDAGIEETIELDATDGAAIRGQAARTGALDILFNGVGWVHHGSVLDCDDDAFDRSFDINVKSMHRTIRAFLPAMIDNGGGSIINMASVAGMKGFPNRYAYGASKAAVIGLTKAVACDFIGCNIRCNAISPGTVQSPSLDERIAELGREAGGEQAARAAFVARQPMGRLGTAEEVAYLAVYLASDESAFTTGLSHVIDGGILG